MEDDLAELRDIIGMEAPSPEPTDDPDAPEPLDGAPTEEDEAASPTPDEMSAEERVAALLAAERGEDGDDGEAAPEDAEADGEEAEAEGSDEDLEALIEEGRAARAARQQQEQLAPYYQVYAEAEQRIADGKAHYASERQRIYDLVHADAQRAVDPDAYLRTHLLPALNGVNAAEEAWVAQIGQDARNRVQAIREEQSLPAWAAHLVAARRLPQAAIARILQTTSDPRAMPAVADLLVEARNALASERRKATQANRSAQARTIAANQVHPSATGRAPSGSAAPELRGTKDELLAILNTR